MIAIAEELKDSDDFGMATEKMKGIQNDWKKIGHVPRKFSDELWKQFKAACNHYFDRINASKKELLKGEEDNFVAKEKVLSAAKEFELVGNTETDLGSIRDFIANWNTIGHVPFKKKQINQQFNTAIDNLFGKLNISKQEAALLQYDHKLESLRADANQSGAIQDERIFVRKMMEESKNEIIQLENNLQFFSNASEDNPLVKDVLKKVAGHKDALSEWKAKLKKINILENDIKKQKETALEE